MTEKSGENGGIDASLSEALACPECHSKLALVDLPDRQALQCRNRGCRLRYPIREAIPVLLIEESEVTSEREFDSLEL